MAQAIFAQSVSIAPDPCLSVHCFDDDGLPGLAVLEAVEAGGDYGRAGGLRTVAGAFWCRTSLMLYAYGQAPLRRRAGVTRFKMLFGVVSLVRMVVLYFYGGCCDGAGALRIVALLAARVALWPQVRAEGGGFYIRRHLSLR